jgi:iron complex transport system ATP-binding protein
MLDVKNIEFSYDEGKVLEDVSFQAMDNEVISIMGPNGVGKTTLLKCLCNFHRPQNGRITIDGKDVSSISSRELAKHIGYVPQRANTTR